MTSLGPQPQSIVTAISELTFKSERTPSSSDEELADAFARLFDYRDGGVFVGHWSGISEWERHVAGDEIVMVVGGETTLTFLVEDCERPALLREGDLVVVPRGTWHKFDTPNRVKVLSVTPLPTDHRADRPALLH